MAEPTKVDYEAMEDAINDMIADAKAEQRDYGSLNDIRKAIRRGRQDATSAEQRGYEKAQQEFQAVQSRAKVFSANGIPDTPLSQRLFEGIDLADTAAVENHLTDLKAQGFSWQPTTQVSSEPTEAPSSLANMSHIAAGGSIPNSDDDRALKLKDFADRTGGDFPTEEDRTFFNDYVKQHMEILGQAARRGA